MGHVRLERRPLFPRGRAGWLDADRVPEAEGQPAHRRAADCHARGGARPHPVRAAPAGLPADSNRRGLAPCRGSDRGRRHGPRRCRCCPFGRARGGGEADLQRNGRGADQPLDGLAPRRLSPHPRRPDRDRGPSRSRGRRGGCRHPHDARDAAGRRPLRPQDRRPPFGRLLQPFLCRAARRPPQSRRPRRPPHYRRRRLSDAPPGLSLVRGKGRGRDGRGPGVLLHRSVREAPGGGSASASSTGACSSATRT